MGVAAPPGAAVKGGLWRRIREVALTDVTALLRGGDAEALEAVERVLIEADFGPVAFQLREAIEQERRRGTLKTEDDTRRWLLQRIAALVRDGDASEPGIFNLGDGTGPAVFLMVGVNGVGKTTQIAKLARRLQRESRTVLLAAADTFRAGASEQLARWGERLGAAVVTGPASGDPAAVAFDAIEAATARKIDVVLIDTAGRLHTHRDLMAELQKIHRVVARRRPGAPHETLLVLDATIGQNAVRQGKAFAAAIPITGLIIAKLDGTAKGGAVVALRSELRLPIRLLGLGEGLDDLEVFDPAVFAERLLAD